MSCAFINDEIAGSVYLHEVARKGGAHGFRIGDNRIADAKCLVVFCFQGLGEMRQHVCNFSGHGKKCSIFTN